MHANIQARPTPRTYEVTDAGFITMTEAQSVSIALPSATYPLIVVDGGANSESANASHSLTAATYVFQGTIDGGTFQEPAKASHALIASVYTNVLVNGGNFTESASASHALNASVYFLAAVNAGTLTESAKASHGLLSASYT
jgi:hypothetical protein